MVQGNTDVRGNAVPPLPSRNISDLFHMAPTVINAIAQHFSRAQNPGVNATNTAAANTGAFQNMDSLTNPAGAPVSMQDALLNTGTGAQQAGAGASQAAQTPATQANTQSKPKGEQQPNSSASGAASSGNGNLGSAVSGATQLGAGIASGNVAAAAQGVGSLISSLTGSSNAQPGQTSTDQQPKLGGSGGTSNSSSGSSQTAAAPTQAQGQNLASTVAPNNQATPTPQNNTDPKGYAQAGPPIGKQPFNAQAAPQSSLNDMVHNLMATLGQQNPQEYAAIKNLFPGIQSSLQQYDPSTSSGLGGMG